jgi:hypothetical protein
MHGRFAKSRFRRAEQKLEPVLPLRESARKCTKVISSLILVGEWELSPKMKCRSEKTHRGELGGRLAFFTTSETKERVKSDLCQLL